MRKPVPRVDATNAPFWQACNEERVLIQRCTDPGCRRFVYYPRVCCPYCHGGELEWAEVSGRGRVVGATLVNRAHHEGFSSEVPYLFAAIELDEGPIVYGRLEAASAHEAQTGRSVEPVFIQHTPEQKLLAFRVAPTEPL